MVRKPLTLFVFVATAGNRLFKVDAERHQSTSLRELSCRSGLEGSSAQLLGNAVVCMAPIASVLRSQMVGQSTTTVATPSSLEIAQEACVALGIALLSAWFVKQALAHRKQVVSPAGQPTQRACVADHSPHKGLAISFLWCLWSLPAQLLQFCRRQVQRRRLYLHAAVTRLEGILPSLCDSSSPLLRLRRACEQGSHGLHDWHEAHPSGFLMPLEVAACRSPPEVRCALQRLLADRWWALEDPPPSLESVPEDECLFMDDALLVDSSAEVLTA